MEHPLNRAPFKKQRPRWRLPMGSTLLKRAKVELRIEREMAAHKEMPMIKNTLLRIVMSIMAVGIGINAYGAGDSDRLYVGTAKVDITPDQAVIPATGGGGTESWRLPDSATAVGPKIPPTNIHDHIFARVLVLKSGKTTLAIVSLDLILFGSKKVIEEAKRKWKVDHVILSSSHVHSSMVARGLCPTPSKRKPPLTNRSWGWDYVHDDPGETVDFPGLSEDPWYAETEKRIVNAIGEAMKNLFPARIVWGRGSFESDYMAHNRRRVNPNGTVTMMWDNPGKLPTKPIDPTVGFIQVNDDSGKPRAFLVHFACHPVGLMNSEMLSRDFPGTMVDYVEKELGDKCMAMFLQGAEGDMDPYQAGLKGEEGFKVTQAAGISLGKGALQVAKSVSQPGKKDVSLRVKKDIVKVGHRLNDKTTEACVTSVVIDDGLALVTIPGEIFIQHQLDLYEKSPIQNTWILGVSYCGAGSPFLIYIPTEQAAKEGGYGADVNMCSFVAGNAGESMVTAAVKSIRELMAMTK